MVVLVFTMTRRWEDAPGIKQAEAKDAVKHLETHRTAALYKELSGTRCQ